MREYGVVSPMFWIGKTGRALRKNPNAQRVAIYLMTAPSSEMTGVFYCPLSSILNDVGVFEAPLKPLTSPSECALEGVYSPFEGVKQAILTLMKLDFCFYDFESEFVFVKEMARWQIGESLKDKDNRVVGLRKYVKSMPKPIAARFIERYNEDFKLGFDLEDYVEWLKGKPSPSEAPSKPLARGSMKPLRSQEQEQEQEQEYINTNKQQTEICNEGSAEEEVVCSEDSVSIFDEPLSEQLNQLAIQQTNKVVDDPNAIIDPVQAIGIARTHGIKLPRTIDLENVCKRKILTVDNMRQCIRLAKRQGNSKGIYVIGIMKNAVNEPSQYHTEEYKTSQRVTLDDVDPNYVFGSEK